MRYILALLEVCFVIGFLLPFLVSSASSSLVFLSLMVLAFEGLSAYKNGFPFITQIIINVFGEKI